MKEIKNQNKWLVVKEGSGFSIRRWVKYKDGTKSFIRLNKSYYSGKSDYSELKNITKVLNYRERKEQDAIDYFNLVGAFIPKDLKNQFYKYLVKQTLNEAYSRELISSLNNHFFSYWYAIKIPDYLHWEERQEDLIHHLMDKKLSKKTIDKVMNIATRFFKWLHKRTGKKTPILLFDTSSISPIVWRKHDLDIICLKGIKTGAYISEHDWVLIKENLYPSIKSAVLLCYYYGLRRSEVLAMNTQDLRKGHLSVERQLISYKDMEKATGPLKSRSSRKVPHYIQKDLSQVKEWIETVVPMHPDTFTDKWILFMSSLKMPYRLHDLRNTYCSNILAAGITIRDAQLAMGHASLKTTERYLRDHRKLSDDEVFIG